MTRHLVVSDVHGDVEALECTAKCAEEIFGKIDDVWNLGDVLGRCEPSEAKACFEWLKPRATVNLLGNWEWWILNAKLDKVHQEKHKPELAKFRDWLDKDPDMLAYLNDWSHFKIISEFHLTLVHGSPMPSYLQEPHCSLPYNLEENTHILDIYSFQDKYFYPETAKTHVFFTGHYHVPKAYIYSSEEHTVTPTSPHEIYEKIREKEAFTVSINGQEQIIRLGSVSDSEQVRNRPHWQFATAMVFDEETCKVSVFEVKK